MARSLRPHGIRLFAYARCVEPRRAEMRQNAERRAQEHGLEIAFIRAVHALRKEDRIQAILAQRGTPPGLGHIFAALEPCAAFLPWPDKTTGRTPLRDKDGKGLPYYVYVRDPECGRCSLRGPTWAPFRLQCYGHGHHGRAGQLQRAGSAFQQRDNTFTARGATTRAQARADAFPIARWHRTLDGFAARYGPVRAHVGPTYHGSLRHVESASDLIVHRQDDRRPLSDPLVRTAVHAVKPDHVATFLGRKLHGTYADELGNDFHTRGAGTRLKHHRGPVALKLYDKQALVLRLETTVNDVSFFQHHRTVDQRDGTPQAKLAPRRTTLYSLAPLRGLLLAAKRRSLAFLSDLTDPSAGVQQVERLAAPTRQDARRSRGFTLCSAEDRALVTAVARGAWPISGFGNRRLRRVLPPDTGPQLARVLKRWHVHGLSKKVGHTYKSDLTHAGQPAVLTARKLRALVVSPSLAGVLSAAA